MKLTKTQTKQECRCHCHFGGNYKDCKAHEALTCKHCQQPKECQQKDTTGLHVEERCQQPNSGEQDDFRTQVSKILVKWGMPTRQAAILEILRVHEALLQANTKQVIESIAKQLSELPFHPEIEIYEGGQNERQVTYTTDIVHLENILRAKYSEGEGK